MDLLFEKAKQRVNKLPRSVSVNELRREITFLRLNRDEAGILIKKLQRKGVIQITQRKARRVVA